MACPARSRLALTWGARQEVPAHRLARGRFQDNFELLQWFFDLVQRKCPDAPASYPGRQRREEAGAYCASAACPPLHHLTRERTSPPLPARHGQRRSAAPRHRSRASSAGQGLQEGEGADDVGRSWSLSRPDSSHPLGSTPAEEYTRSHSRSLLPSASEVVAQIAQGVGRRGDREREEEEEVVLPRAPVHRVGPYEAEDLEDLVSSSPHPTPPQFSCPARACARSPTHALPDFARS